MTAVGSSGRNLTASATVRVSATTGPVGVDSLSLLQGSTCSPSWLPTFGDRPGTTFDVNALAVYDDGGGPALYVGGAFGVAGGGAANRIARWDGSNWSALGNALNDSVNALAVYDDGGGPALYAGGDFVITGPRNIARWDGSSWSALGSGVLSTVHALAVYDDGAGPALYAGGDFPSAPDSEDSYLAKWGCLDTTPPVLDCPSSISFRDTPANGAGEVVSSPSPPPTTWIPRPASSARRPRGATFLPARPS